MAVTLRKPPQSHLQLMLLVIPALLFLIMEASGHASPKHFQVKMSLMGPIVYSLAEKLTLYTSVKEVLGIIQFPLAASVLLFHTQKVNFYVSLLCKSLVRQRMEHCASSHVKVTQFLRPSAMMAHGIMMKMNLSVHEKNYSLIYVAFYKCFVRRKC